jgi:hypothetical protein
MIKALYTAILSGKNAQFRSVRSMCKAQIAFKKLKATMDAEAVYFENLEPFNQAPGHSEGHAAADPGQ